MCRSTFLSFLAMTLVTHGSTNILAIGDSLTREYEIMSVNDGQGGTFPSPDSDPGNANTMNWVEILTQERSSSVDFGHFSDDTGHEYNYAIPGYDTKKWMDIIHATIFEPQFLFIRERMRQDYDEVDVVIVMVGGNDVNFTYGQLYDPEPGDITPADFKAEVVANITDIIDEIRSVNETVPIILADIPDASPTPDIIADHPDAQKRANVTQIVEELNQQLANLATSRGLTFAAISSLTDQLSSTDPIFIGAIEMIKDKDPSRENRPLYLFCKEGLHPSTNGQAIIANTLIEAINTATGSNIEKLPSRTILQSLMGLNPDQPFIDWLSNNGITNHSLTLDSDGDGIPNLGEYLLGKNPLIRDDNFHAIVTDVESISTLSMTYSTDAAASKLASTVVKQSTDLSSWASVLESHIHPLPNGSFQVRIPTNGQHKFLRMEFKLRP